MAPRGSITLDQRRKENSIFYSLIADMGILTIFFIVGIVGGSLTIIAEMIRGTLMNAIEGFSLLVMRRVHRETLFTLEFGPGKLERVANVGIAISMVIGALWVFINAILMILGDRELASPFGLALAAVCAAINLFINLLAWDAVRRAAQTGKSVIMQAQLKSREVKLLSSVFILAALTVAALTPDPVIVTWAEVIGSTIVAGVILFNAIDLFRAGLPDLLDRSVDESAQIAINRALAKHFDDYESLGRVRSRRSGHRTFIEVALGFDETLTMTEVGRRIVAIGNSMQTEIENADVSILASSHSKSA
ncbi:MAG: cation diffusion facilitator family transporter [Dongiaceae bacterium]